MIPQSADFLAEALKEPNGSNKASSSRAFLCLAALSYILAYLIWLGIGAGIAVGLWGWDVWEGYIVAGGIGLLGIIFGAVTAYRGNKKWTSYESFEDIQIGDEGRDWQE